MADPTYEAVAALVERLRLRDIPLLNEAADMLEALQRRVQELTDDNILLQAQNAAVAQHGLEYAERAERAEAVVEAARPLASHHLSPPHNRLAEALDHLDQPAGESKTDD